MATLPNIPVNSAVTAGALAVLGVVAYTATLRHKLDSQVHENYRQMKMIDAGHKPENTTKPQLVKES